MLEAYCAFGDYATMMETVESLITTVAQKVLGTLKIEQRRDSELKTELCLLFGNLEEIRTECLPSEALKSLWSEWITNVLNEIRSCLERVGKQPSSEIAIQAKNSVEEFRKNFEQTPNSKEYLAKYTGYHLHFKRNILERLVKLELLSKPHFIDLTPPWPRCSYKDLVRNKVREKTDGKIADWFELPPDQRRRIANDKLRIPGVLLVDEDFEVTNAVFEKLIEPTLINPTFVTHLPKELVPLAKLSPDDPTTVEVFECCINGQEISPGYTEQNDPIAQRTTLEHQAGGEQQKLDEDFLVALEHGMPPAGGIGIGIDRLCMMLLGQESIRDVILFPQLKPK
jgi:lysyl-tRNA synthetase class 2